MIINKKNMYIIIVIFFIIISLYLFYINKNKNYNKNYNKNINNEKYTAIIIEPRKHKALQFVLENFIENLSNEWNIIIFHGNQNINFINNILNNISSSLKNHKDRISLINLRIDNLTINEYNKLLFSKELYNHIPTEVFLIFQTDTMICKDFKNMINDYIQYDYVGAPWGIRRIKEFNRIVTTPDYKNPYELYKMLIGYLGFSIKNKNKIEKLIGNGGLSLRRKSKMLEIINKCPNQNMNEDVYFSIPCKNEIHLNKPSYEDALLFSNESTYTENSFGVHKPWGNMDENEIISKNKTCKGLNTLIDLNNIESTLNDNNPLTNLFDVNNPWLFYNDKNNFKENVQTERQRMNSSYDKVKEPFLNQGNEKYTAIIIETRIHNSLPVVLKNFLDNLPEQWDIIIFHGTGNNNFINSIIDTTLSNYRHRLQLINLNVDELSITEYNNMLLSREFYNYIQTEMFLIFQIDSFICSNFKDTINEFLEYDYVGSPWKHSYTEKLIENSMYKDNGEPVNADADADAGSGDGDVNRSNIKNKYFEYNDEPTNEMNKRLIGSGGLSLRRKSKMIEIIENCPANNKVPEDIYFSIPCNRIKVNKPPYNKAMEFSMESIYSDKSFGINKPWLYLTDDEIIKKNATCPGIKNLYDLNNNQYKNNNVDIIVARYAEDLEWMNEVPFSNYRYIIYNKGDDDNFEKRYAKKIIKLRNNGKCDETYLHHIVHNYDNLNEINVFLPGSLDLYYKKKIALSLIYEIEKNKTAVFISLNVNDVKKTYYDFTMDSYQTQYPKNFKKNKDTEIQKSPIRPFGLWFSHFFGDLKVDCVMYYGIFSVHRDDIIQHNKSRYETILKQLQSPNPEVGHYSERIYNVLFYPMKKTLIIKYNKI